ncbi:MAG: peptidoglycan-binding protein [Candidatus Omnitrophica bacterium]|nr:peptidoglycan-binding protein [Candidatus Omnitrophota bacterium]
MKRSLSFAVMVLMLVALSGCGKKQEIDEWQPIDMESLSTVTGSTQGVFDFKNKKIKVIAPMAKESLPLPPQGPYGPSVNGIQTALKNAGFYTERVDGKIGPKSKKAIKDFQSANGLKVDGKVGPKTWEALGKYLSVTTEPVKR